MATTALPPPLAETANPAPVRPLNSVRRTSSIDVFWPDGPQADRLFVGRVRDYLTPSAGGPGRVCAEAAMEAVLKDDKTIVSLKADPAPANIGELAGARAGGHLRMIVKERWPELIEQGMPLYLVLDDLSGTALVSPTAKIQLDPDWSSKLRREMSPEQYQAFIARRIDICWGLAEGNSGVTPGGARPTLASADAGELRNAEDPEGWHEFPDREGPTFRRARRIDVQRHEATGRLMVNSSFQDSIRRRDGTRGGIHEYLLDAEIDARTLEILTITPEPRILPYPECPGAVHNTQRLLGARITDIRDQVLANLRGPEGCTHLNDALRALAEVPRLAAYLD
ncbi:MAG TPA: DUF2889 domain-containing protein [Novosphingobium sp.]|nr:DUF2889 domain-containing protein [Novosphingobium sp.]